MFLIVMVGILFLLTVGVIVAGVMASRQGDTATQQRLGQFVGGLNEEAAEDNDQEQKSSAPSALTQSLEHVIEERGLGRNMATELARADLKITVAEFWALNIISILGMGALAAIIYRGNIFLILIGLVAGFFIPKMFVKIRKNGRLKAFNNQLGDGLTLMANGLRAGYSLLQAMEAVGREMPPPLSVEFRRVVREIGLGVDHDRAFNNLMRRVPSDDLDLVVTAIAVQQEIGGNLSEILETIGEVIRERVRIKGEIQVLTAQGQLSGYVISFLPIALGLILYAMNQEYIGRMIFTCESRGVGDELCSQPCGWILIGVALFGIAVGFFAIQKIIDIEV
jgi:tight adherence protein B